MSAVLGRVLAFLLEHLDVVEALVEALEGGVSKDALKAAIRAEMVRASDEAMRRELG